MTTGLGPAARQRPLTASRDSVQLPYMAITSTRTERIELRAEPSRARRLRRAARLRGLSLSAFMLDAASESAEKVLEAEATTAVPPAFFDEIWAALDRPAKANPALVELASARRRVSQR